MKYLLTSAGIKNTSIHNALVEMLGKPIAESSALCVPTAMYGHPCVGPGVWGMGIHRRTRAPTPHVRTRVEVRGRAGAHALPPEISAQETTPLAARDEPHG